MGYVAAFILFMLAFLGAAYSDEAQKDRESNERIACMAHSSATECLKLYPRRR